ncbi:cytochrome P450 [Sphaerisporangium sp. NPDC005289]|uniref:cytochrome P450 family protein n=1 Tax=Sphaerisporangium sp. NPDC005289 TaxID=3155247 RepID=UPI0033BCF5CA
MTTHNAVNRVLGDQCFAKSREHWRDWQRGRIPADWPLISWVAVDNMLTADGADHRRLRTLVSAAFTTRRVQELHPRIVAITRDLLNRMADMDGRHVDLKNALALPLPLTVISELFGVPTDKRQQLQNLCSTVFDQTISPAQAASAHQGLQDTLADIVAAKRADPAEDLTTALIAARDGHDRLSETELIWTLVLMIGAGYETTTNLITNAVRALLTHPDQLALVTSGRRPWDAVIQETLRWDPPIANMPLRFTTQPVQIQRVRIPKGQAMLLCFAAAGRDPAQHGTDADRFDITRTQRRNLAFGHGPHACLGAALAQLEARITLPMLFDRYPDLALAVPETALEHLSSIVASGLAALPVTY